MLKHVLRLLVAAFVFVTSVLGAVGSETEELQKLFDDYWTAQMKGDPFSATGSGVYDFNHLVPDVSPAAIRERVESTKEFQSRLKALDLAQVSESDRVSAEILRFILSKEIELSAFDTWRIPFVSDSGFHNRFGYVVSSTPFRSERDYQNYLQRLEKLPGYYQQNVENMRMGLMAGFSQPKAILGNVIPSFEALADDDLEAHPFYAPFKKVPASISRTVAEEIIKEGRRLMQTRVIPAHKELVRFMKEEYVAQARDSLGASLLPDGKAYYASLIRYFTTLDDETADSIHHRGLSEVARIRKEMDAIIKEVGFKGSFAEFLEFLRSDPQFYPATADELLKEAAWIAKQTDGKLPAFFGKLPRQPYSVEPVPAELAPNYTAGRYSGAPPGSDRGGQYWVNTYALETRTLYQLVALSLHEGVPGHHLQISLAYEIEDAPKFRTQYYPHAFGEGWGFTVRSSVWRWGCIKHLMITLVAFLMRCGELVAL